MGGCFVFDWYGLLGQFEGLMAYWGRGMGVRQGGALRYVVMLLLASLMVQLPSKPLLLLALALLLFRIALFFVRLVSFAAFVPISLNCLVSLQTPRCPPPESSFDDYTAQLLWLTPSL